MSQNNTNFSSKSKDTDSKESGIYSIYKNKGETLSELVSRFRKENFFGDDLPITYAGRLDPMADGLVLVITGKMCKEKDKYLGLEKTYVFEVLFGISTDTFDMLGLVKDLSSFHLGEEGIQKTIEVIKNTKEFPYPPYSSKPIEGKPLFVHAKEGTLPKEMPVIKGEVKSLILKDIREESLENILKNSFEIIKNVKGDFRQEEIISSWKKTLEENKGKNFMIGTFEANVSSGIYIRTLATIFGGLAYSINRTKIGDFEI